MSHAFATHESICQLILHYPFHRLDEAMENIRRYIPMIGDERVEEWCLDFMTYLDTTWLNGLYPR